MVKRCYQANYYAWLLITVTLVLAGFSLITLNWDYEQWSHTFLSACHRLYSLREHAPVIWQLVVLGLILTIGVRGGWSVGQQLHSTQRFTRLFLPFRKPPPPRLLD